MQNISCIANTMHHILGTKGEGDPIGELISTSFASSSLVYRLCKTKQAA